MVMEEEAVPYLRIEADGYETVETEIQLTNGVEGVRDFQLSHTSVTNSIRGKVLLPDGTPAAGVEVALCTGQVGVMLKGTAFEPGAFGNINPSQRPDTAEGRTSKAHSRLTRNRARIRWWRLGWPGWVGMRCFDFSIRGNPAASVGRVEGTIRTRDGQWADRKLKWRRDGNLTRWMTLFYDSKGFSTRSDETGKFTLEHVPPGDGRLEIDDGPGTAPTFSSAIQVNSGETVQAQIGGVGRGHRKVAGPVWRRDPKLDKSGDKRPTAPRMDSYQMPKNLTGIAAERWKLEFEDTEAGRAWFRDQCSYSFKVAADSPPSLKSFRENNRFVNVSQGNLGSGPDSTPRYGGEPRIASSGMKFAVPEASGDSEARLDLGEIILTADH